MLILICFKRFEATLFTAPTIALSIGLLSAISFLPNVTILVLKFRSGVTNTVRDHGEAPVLFLLFISGEVD